MATAAPTTTRPLRRDAARNLERVLAAATEVFGEQGLDAGVEEIAARAGVGLGTLYRRFPTKEALIGSLVDTLVREMLGLGQQALAEPDGKGLEHFLRGIGELQLAHSGCLERLWRGGLSTEQREELRGVLRVLLQRACAAGTVRAEVTVGDIAVLLWSLQHIVTMTATIAPDAWRRHLDILLAGIAPDHRPITHAAMTPQEVATALAQANGGPSTP